MIDKTAIINTAQKLASKGQIDKAIAEWEKLLVNVKDGNIHNTIGDLYLKKNSEPAAIESFTKAAELFKKDGFYPKAIALYKKILNIVPNDVNSLIALAKLNADKGLVANAIEYYFKAAEIYHREGSTESATLIADRIVKLSTSDIETRKKIAYLYFRLGLRERAANEYASIASTFLDNNEYQNADEMYNQAIEFEPENTAALAGLSKLAENENDMEKALGYLKKATSFEPENTALTLRYSTLLINNNRTDEARDCLIKLSKAHPADLYVKKILGTLYLKDNKTEEAWEQLLPCIDGVMEAEEWSEAHELLHNFKESFPLPVKERILKICRAHGDEETIRAEIKELAVLYEQDHAYDDALNLYKEFLESVPDDSTSLQKIQELEIKLGISLPVEDATPSEEPISSDAPQQPEILHNDVVESPLTEPIKPHSVIQEGASAAASKLAERKAEADFFAQQGLNDEAQAIYEELASANADSQSPPQQAVVPQESEPLPEILRNDAVASPFTEPVKPDSVTQEAASAPADNLSERKAEADFFAQQGLNDEALEIYEELISLHPDNKDIARNIELLKPSQAEVSPSSAEEEVLAEEADQQIEATAAVTSTTDDDLKDIFSAFGNNENEKVDYESRYQKGLEFRMQGLLDEAIKELQVAAQDPDKMARNSTMLAMCYKEKKLYPQAIAEFSKVMESMTPSDSTYLHVKYELATAHLNNMDPTRALELYTEIHSQEPGFKDVSEKISSLQPVNDDSKPKPKRDRVSYI